MNPQTKQNEVWKPSFTLPQYGCSLIDYLKQEDQIPDRIHIFRYNHIPATVLGPKDLDQPHWRQDLYEHIQQYLKFPEYRLDQFLKS